MANNFNTGIGAAGILFGLASLGYAIYQDSKRNKLEQEVRDKIGMSFDSVASKATIDIDQSIVDSAIKKIAERKIDKIASNTVSEISNKITSDISKKVSKEIDAQYESLSEQVTDKISEQVAAISDSALSNRILPKVESRLMKEGEVMLKRVEEEQNRNLQSVIDLHKGIAKLIQSNVGGGHSSSGRGIRVLMDD